MARERLVAGNWKMHGSRASIAALLDELAKANPPYCAVCAPFPYLGQVAERLRGTRIAWGAQNVSEHAQGAYTGEVSAAMLAEFGCRYAIVGHSERRQIFGEVDDVVNRKLHAALKHGLRPILCVGETKPQRDAGEAEAIVVGQVRAGLANVDATTLREVVIAYQLGATPEADAYRAAFQIPDLLNQLLAAGAFSIAFLPLYTRARAERGDAAADELLAVVFGTMTGVAAGLTLILWLLAEPLVALQFPRFSPEQQALPKGFPFRGWHSRDQSDWSHARLPCQRKTNRVSRAEFRR